MNNYIIDKPIIKILYTLLENVHNLFKQNKIQYWIDGGTILGAIRHKGIIPWDDDIDISVFKTKENIFKINKLKSELKKKGYGLYKSFYGYKIYLLNGTPIKKNLWRDHKKQFKLKNPHIKGRSNISKYASKTYKKSSHPVYEGYKYPFLDIFFAKEKEDKIIYPNNHWKNCYYLKNDFYPLKLYNFKNIKVYGPNNPIMYLEQCYGKNWNDEAIIKYDHKKEKMIKPIIFKLTKKHKHPA